MAQRSTESDTSPPLPMEAVAVATGLPAAGVRAACALLAEGCTVPFIARYRKERTGGLDEVQLAAVRDTLDREVALQTRKQSILGSLTERDLLTPELRRAIDAAADAATLEDLYRPYKPKRRTRATIARERGLEPLAERLFRQDPVFDPEKAAGEFVSPEKEVPDRAAALAGARDIIAEWVAEDPKLRATLKDRIRRQGTLSSRLVRGKDKEKDAAKFRDYFDWSELARQAPAHRVLALLRGEREGVLSVSLRLDDETALPLVERAHVKNRSRAGEQVREASVDGYRRLLAPSLETELRGLLKERADRDSIAIFAENLRTLLFEAPLGAKRLLAIDPGFRTGCKWVALDETGDLKDHGVIDPHTGDRARDRAAETVRKICQTQKIEAIAVGNGTAGRETEAFLRSLELPPELPVVLVNESGASIYSASEVAREEFPELDLTVRGAISIGRRLMDPLAELVKLDPKTIGVGQYQHDVDPKALERALDDVVAGCVNGVGVEVNQASAQLLARVSGLGPQLAKNIVEYRASNGPFRSRAALKKVPRLGPKAFEQCAGFLRITDAKNPLDRSAVHPERYGVVDAMAKRAGCSLEDLVTDAGRRASLDLTSFVDDEVGLPTLEDIFGELERPGRDPRAAFEVFSFADVNKIEDLHPGQSLPGIVTNVTAFGAFVDVGVHQDGLVHVSQLADRFVRDPNEIVKVGDRVTVRVVSVELERGRIGFSMRSETPAPGGGNA